MRREPHTEGRGGLPVVGVRECGRLGEVLGQLSKVLKEAKDEEGSCALGMSL